VARWMFVCVLAGVTALSISAWARNKAHLTRGSGLTGSGSVDDSRVSAHSALKTFSLGFDLRDNKIKGIGVRNRHRGANFLLRDRDARESYRASARWQKVPAKRRRARRLSCRKSCKLKLRGRKPGEVFALSGFWFSRSNAGDSNIRRIKVQVDSAQKNVEVTFTDNGGFYFNAEVDYVWLPKAAVTRTTTWSARSNNGRFKLGPGKDYANAVLRGFDVQFLNGDHHLSTFKIDHCNHAGYCASFHDFTPKDPTAMRVHVALLNPSKI
jgi:hypothetical protein